MRSNVKTLTLVAVVIVASILFVPFLHRDAGAIESITDFGQAVAGLARSYPGAVAGHVAMV